MFALLICLIFAVSIVHSKEYTVHAIVKGKVEKIFVSEGDRVRKGQPLIKVNDDIYMYEVMMLENKVLAKEKEFLKIKKDFERYKELYERDFLERSKYERIELDLKKVKAELEQIKAHLRKVRTLKEFTLVVSPFDGIVKSVLVGENSYVNGECNPHPVVIIEIR